MIRAGTMAAAMLAALVTLEAKADERADLHDDLKKGYEALEDQAQDLAEDFGIEAERAVKELLQLVGPMIESLSLFVEGLPAYHTPEVLPNGDIIIRRKSERDKRLKTPAGPEEEIDT